MEKLGVPCRGDFRAYQARLAHATDHHPAFAIKNEATTASKSGPIRLDSVFNARDWAWRLSIAHAQIDVGLFAMAGKASGFVEFIVRPVEVSKQ